MVKGLLSIGCRSDSKTEGSNSSRREYLEFVESTFHNPRNAAQQVPQATPVPKPRVRGLSE
jgi:hypothetical protein